MDAIMTLAMSIRPEMTLRSMKTCLGTRDFDLEFASRKTLVASRGCLNVEFTNLLTSLGQLRSLSLSLYNLSKAGYTFIYMHREREREVDVH